jgi:hypothetical protein
MKYLLTYSFIIVLASFSIKIYAHDFPNTQTIDATVSHFEREYSGLVDPGLTMLEQMVVEWTTRATQEAEQECKGPALLIQKKTTILRFPWTSVVSVLFTFSCENGQN